MYVSSVACFEICAVLSLSPGVGKSVVVGEGWEGEAG